MPPPTCEGQVSSSESSATAKIAARNGCRFATSVAREGPTRSIAVNQRKFVRTSGPRTAKANPAQTRALEIPVLVGDLRRRGQKSGIAPITRAPALIRQTE